jgi:hypothetical protein
MNIGTKQLREDMYQKQKTVDWIRAQVDALVKADKVTAGSVSIVVKPSGRA